MKTVKELIEFLKTQDQEMKIQTIYDGFESDIYIFISTDSNRLCISNDDYDSTYKVPTTLFFSRTDFFRG